MAKYKFAFSKDGKLINTLNVDGHNLTDAQEQADYIFNDLIKQGFTVEPVALPSEKSQSYYKYDVRVVSDEYDYKFYIIANSYENFLNKIASYLHIFKFAKFYLIDNKGNEKLI